MSDSAPRPLFVGRWQSRPETGLWPIKCREPLPTIPIAFASARPEAMLDLQATVYRVDNAAGYDDI